MKKIIALLLIAALLTALSLAGCSSGENTADATDAQQATEAQQEMSEEDKAITDAVYANFVKLTEVPRPSHHEEKISKFLCDWAKEKGYDAVQDDAMNVIFDVPATSGKENLPLVALQGHMDMVAVADEGVEFDPLNDPIKPIRDDAAGTITADGTTLGADDGAGVSTIMTFLESDAEHGPLRVIITTNEEDGMTGTFNLDEKWLQDPKYLINLDAVDSGSAIVSTAGGILVKGSKKVKTVKPEGDTAIKVTLGGLKGGHSGVDIDKGRCNAVVALAKFLKSLSEQNIEYELASFEGGSAANAISDKAECLIVVDASNKDAVKKAVEDYLSKLKDEYQNIEDGITLSAEDAELPDSVISEEDKERAAALASEIINGVYSMSSEKEGLVESSSNLGLFSLTADGNTFTAYMRSSVADKQTEIVDAEKALAEKNGFTVTTEKSADPWPYNPDNKLMQIASDVYKKINGTDFDLIALHAGLECGTYAEENPDLQMISIGGDIRNEHTPDETWYIASIPKMYKLLCGILLEVE